MTVSLFGILFYIFANFYYIFVQNGKRGAGHGIMVVKTFRRGCPMIWTVKISARGRVTIPAAVRKQLELVPGSEVTFLRLGKGSEQLVKTEALADAAVSALQRARDEGEE